MKSGVFGSDGSFPKRTSSTLLSAPSLGDKRSVKTKSNSSSQAFNGLQEGERCFSKSSDLGGTLDNDSFCFSIAGDFSITGTCSGDFSTAGDFSITGKCSGDFSIAGDFSITGMCSGDFSIAGDFSITGACSGDFSIAGDVSTASIFSFTGDVCTATLSSNERSSGLFVLHKGMFVKCPESKLSEADEVR